MVRAERTARSGRRAGINSDARYRFERGVDPAFVVKGLELATRMVLDLCGGEPSEIVGRRRRACDPPDRRLPPVEVKRLSGLDLSSEQVTATLEALGFTVEGLGEAREVLVPSWRPDVHGKADLVEEVVRIAGLDQVKPTPLPRLHSVGTKVLTPIQVRTRRAKRALAARGLVEAVTWSFISEAQAALFGGGSPALKLANPISADMSDMRPSLIPGLVTAAQRNADRGLSDVALFEVGQVFAATARRTRPSRRPSSGAARPVRGGFGTPLVRQGRPGLRLRRQGRRARAPRRPRLRHLQGPDRSRSARLVPSRPLGSIKLGPKVTIGTFVRTAPGRSPGPRRGRSAGRLRDTLDAIPEPKAKAVKSKPALALSGLMPVSRDFAFVVDDAVEAARIVKAAEGAEPQADRRRLRIRLLRGEHVGAGRKSVAIEVTLTQIRAHPHRGGYRRGVEGHRRRGAEGDRRHAAGLTPGRGP